MPHKQPPVNRQFGQPEGNKPQPKPKGALNRKTIFEIALKEVATALKLGHEPDSVKVELVKRGVREGLAANYPFWKDIMKALELLEDEKSNVLIPIQVNIEKDRERFG